MRGREIMIETKTPELTEPERAERYRAIECGLFEIFVNTPDGPLEAAPAALFLSALSKERDLLWMQFTRGSP